MERLTEKHYRRNDYYMKCSEECTKDGLDCGDCICMDELVDRLAAYEDTGLEPEEIEHIVDAYGRGVTLQEEVGQLIELIRRIKIDRLRELVKAEQEGRVVVLPVRPSLKPCGANEIFLVEDGEVYDEYVSDISVGENSQGELSAILYTFSGDCFSIEDVGKIVFFTRDEADKLLKEGNAHA